MMAKTGLLVLTNPKHISKILPTVQKQVKKTLYIHLASALKEPLGRFRPEIFTSTPKYSQTIRGIYSEAAAICKDLDVRVLLSGLKLSSINSLNTLRQVEVVIFDRLHEKTDIDSFLKTCVTNIKEECAVITLEHSDLVVSGDFNGDDICKEYKHVVLGGTFDRLHTGHKMLLSEAILRSTDKVTVGVTDTNMLSGKTLWELVEPCNIRMESVKNFANDICPELHYNVVPIQDPYGPTKTGEDMEMIVVSAETVKGGVKVNDIRKENGLNALDIHTVELVDCPDRQAEEEEKISSSTNRMRMLGTLLQEINTKTTENTPYVIGLTGGIASGKSSISKRLSNLGATVMDIDKVAHELYQIDKPCYKIIRETFGEAIIAENGEINRKALGSIVFHNKDEMLKLNSLVWPAIANEVKMRIAQLHESNHKVVVLEAAILYQAGWHRMCNEVWACVIPSDEAVQRLMERNGLSEADARARLTMQTPNKEHVDNAHVVLCTLWSYEYTQQIVERAWKLLKERIPISIDSAKE